MATITPNRRFNDAIEVRYAALEEVRQGLAEGTISFGEAIRQLRTGVTGLSQSDFARACKLSLRTVRLLEQDEGNPTVATLNSIFRLFGMQVGVVPVRRSPVKLCDEMGCIRIGSTCCLTSGKQLE